MMTPPEGLTPTEALRVITGEPGLPDDWSLNFSEVTFEGLDELWFVETRRTHVARWLRRWVCRAVGHDFSHGMRYVEHPSGIEILWCSRCRSIIKAGSA